MTLLAQQNDPICHLNPDVGPCDAIIWKYYYNSTLGKCEKFSYGGCKGNKNRFDSYDKCMAFCDVNGGTKTLFCEEDSADPGPCRAHMTRFFFNKNTRKCESFVYGGCGGNQNNFRTLEQCNAICNQPEKSKDESICNQNYQVGPCKGRLSRFYFNSTTGHCEPFIYGGCGGNANNFKTVEECKANCGAQQSSQTKGQKSKEEICNQNYDTGKCFGYFRKYYFNSATGQCEEFTYGGCKGNENNFPTKESCEQFCMS